MKELTKRQEEYLFFIKGYLEANGFPPTVRDASEYFGVSVKASHDHFKALEKKGFLMRDGRARGLFLGEDLPLSDPQALIASMKRESSRRKSRRVIPHVDSCIICGRTGNVHRHHENYDDPAHVLFLCNEHHLLWHNIKASFERRGFSVVVSEARV